MKPWKMRPKSDFLVMSMTFLNFQFSNLHNKIRKFRILLRETNCTIWKPKNLDRCFISNLPAYEHSIFHKRIDNTDEVETEPLGMRDYITFFMHLSWCPSVSLLNE
jgi:hypothetical protein